jgi:hypothetical protein
VSSLGDVLSAKARLITDQQGAEAESEPLCCHYYCWLSLNSNRYAEKGQRVIDIHESSYVVPNTRTAILQMPQDHNVHRYISMPTHHAESYKLLQVLMRPILRRSSDSVTCAAAVVVAQVFKPPGHLVLVRNAPISHEGKDLLGGWLRRLLFLPGGN